MLDIITFSKMILSGANLVISAENELTSIDAKFGDADHGITMSKVMNNVIQTTQTVNENTNFNDFLNDLSMTVMSINGGSAVPLWSTLLEGMSEGAPSKNKLSCEEFKQIFKKGLEELSIISKAKYGDKTMMDALIPAVEAIENSDGDFSDIIKNGSEAAINGAKASEGFVSKFGRAKSYKEQTIGTADAGAVSMKYFFVGMSNELN